MSGDTASLPRTKADIVEGTYYDHDEYGRVKVRTVSSDDVEFLCEECTRYVPGVGPVNIVTHESPSAFCARTEPAAAQIGLPATELGVTTPDIGD